jgi:hypothetical protein
MRYSVSSDRFGTRQYVPQAEREVIAHEEHVSSPYHPVYRHRAGPTSSGWLQRGAGAVCHRDPDADQHLHANEYGDGNVDVHCHADPYANGHAHANRNADVHADRDTHSHVDEHAHSNADADEHADAHIHPRAHKRAGSDANAAA